jgi:hypothetical protein
MMGTGDGSVEAFMAAEREKAMQTSVALEMVRQFELLELHII